MGQLMLIRGTEVSFYMPPTGIEVVPDETNQFVRSAVTLERLEYCILLDEGGNKRYVRGPAVVFPEPTETFIKSGEARKFRAIDLNPHSGLYIKVISPYKDGGKEHKEGDELFITGKDQMIYFPRPEHAIIKYGDQSVHYAVAIPAGEARYVLDRDTGTISTVKGPAMFLPDPRRQVIVRRVLDEKTVTLWYPGNVKALEYNRTLAAQGFSGFSGERASRSASPKLAMYAASTQAKGLVDAEEVVANMAAPYSNAWEAERPSSDLALDEVQRKGRFTQPRTLSLDTKYEGAPAINVWTGYAVMVVGKNGARQIVQGPKTVLLEYDETLEVMELSMGTPKSDITMRTVYLRVSSNKVSDLVQAMTKDMVNVSIKLSYRVNFEGDTAKWFNVENYVKFLTDHLRSIIRNAIKQVGIENFNNDAIQIVRTAILGPGDTETKRIGKSFQENGMRTYDVEILDVAIGDSSIATMLVATQHQVVKQTIAVAQREAELEATKRSEKIQQQIDASKAETRLLSFELQTKLDEGDCALKAAMQGSQAVLTKARLDTEAQEQKLLEQIAQAQLARKQATEDQRLGIVSRENELKAVAINAEAEAVIKRAGAVTPQMIAALQAFGDKVFVEKLLTALGPHALLRGNSVADVFAQLVNGSPQLGDKLTNLLSMASVPEREKKEEATV
jgi:major vault protein